MLAGPERVAELAEIDELRDLRFADDELRAVLDRLVLVRKAPRQRVARVVGPLDDLEQLALDEVHQAHGVAPVNKTCRLQIAGVTAFGRLQPAGDGAQARADEAATETSLSERRVAHQPGESGLGLPPRALQLQWQRRVDGLAGPIRPLQLLDQRLGLLHVEHRQRRAAVAARGCLREIHRRAAVRAVERLDVLPQLGDLRRRERADEVLLAQEVEERRQPAVAVRAAQVLEAGGALHVAGAPQAAPAARALRELGGAWRASRAVCSPMTRKSASVEAGVRPGSRARRTRTTGRGRRSRSPPTGRCGWPGCAPPSGWCNAGSSRPAIVTRPLRN